MTDIASGTGRRPRIAIVGAGISGLVTAHQLAADFDVHVFDANGYAGGHSNTVDVTDGGPRLAIDTGFIVYNERTYPRFTRLLKSLEVATQPSEMSFSVSCEKTGLEWAGQSLNALFAQRSNIVRLSFHRMIRDILRFNREATTLVKQEGNERLKADGLMLLQTITVRDQSYEDAVSCVDFIKRYIFPGGCLPSVNSLSRVLTGATDFQLLALNDIGLDYALTLKHWRERFAKNLHKVRALGYDERFIRMGWFYFCYCEAGFLEHFVSDVQITLGRRDCRQRPIVASADAGSGSW